MNFHQEQRSRYLFLVNALKGARESNNVNQQRLLGTWVADMRIFICDVCDGEGVYNNRVAYAGKNQPVMGETCAACRGEGT